MQHKGNRNLHFWEFTAYKASAWDATCGPLLQETVELCFEGTPFWGWANIALLAVWVRLKGERGNRGCPFSTTRKQVHPTSDGPSALDTERLLRKFTEAVKGGSQKETRIVLFPIGGCLAVPSVSISMQR